MKLSETIEMMNSADYKEKFKAEYYQLAIRYYGLCRMIEKWDNNELDFTPTCPRSMYDFQMKTMADYMMVLEKRADLEEIKLDFDKVGF